MALENNGNTARALDFVHSCGVGVEVERRARLVSHEGAGEVASAVQGGVGEAERFLAGGIVDEVAVAGVHVDGGNEAGARGALDVVCEAFPIDVTIFLKREQDGGVAFDAAMWPEHLDGVEGGRVHGRMIGCGEVSV